MTEKFDGFPHVLESQQFSRDWLEDDFFPHTKRMERIFKTQVSNTLGGKRMVSLFYAPSTRTRASFEFAMHHLGGSVVFSTENAREFSSAKKGETLDHTLKVLGRYQPDVIVLRYDGQIDKEMIQRVSKVPIINGGDRDPGQHPTQALLDLYTILKCRGCIDGLNITMVGDLDKGRTVRSLAYLLGKFNGISINFVSPETSKIGGDIKQYLIKHGVKFQELRDLREVAGSTNCVYQTRTQTECGSSFERKGNGGYYVIDGAVADMMPRNSIIMHPLPIDGEITSDVDENPRSVYLTDQVDSGLFTRMALLEMILARNA